MFKRILVPLDMSSPETGVRSCPLARDLSKQFGAEVHLMSVMPGYNLPLVASYFPKDAQDKMKAQILTDMHKIGAEYFTDSVEYTVSSGKRAAEILELAEGWKSDLIIFGCRPKDALGGELMLGSCGSAVAERAKCSVLVAR